MQEWLSLCVKEELISDGPIQESSQGLGCMSDGGEHVKEVGTALA